MLKIKIMNLIECNRCKKEKTPDMFIGTKGQKCKMCLSCREYVMKSQLKNKCPHGIRKDFCQKGCGGSGICKHGKRKYYCREGCGGSVYCEHGISKRYCREGCGGSAYCEHGIEKKFCREGCGGSGVCIHNIEKYNCKECNPKGHLRNIVKNRIRHALKSKKSKRTLEYLGCNMEFFKTHIEKQFTEGMTWDNMGEWEIDHITPIMYNEPSMEEVVERLHWSNTQPLWKADNRAKGNRWIG